MPEFCSCGAQLPPDALFCHKCGKPQRELLAPEPEVQAERPRFLPPREVIREALPLNFRNAAAVRIALVVAAGSTLVFFFLPFLNWVFGGFFAVFFYRRRTGSLLNLGAGMRMGWITGVLAFALYIVPFALQLPRMSSLVQERLRGMSADPAMIAQMMGFFQSGAGMAMIVAFTLAAMFLIITFLSMAGGALGAKVVGRQ
jgi:zinc-ribbon domain